MAAAGDFMLTIQFPLRSASGTFGWVVQPTDTHRISQLSQTKTDYQSRSMSSLERLLRNATHITVQLADREKSIDLDRHRMSKLLKAVDRCRRAALK